MLAEADELKSANGRLKLIERAAVVAEEVGKRVRVEGWKVVRGKLRGDMRRWASFRPR